MSIWKSATTISLGVIGPNGGGKTTLVKAILGTVPHTGEICLAPELFRGKERLIGYMPQLSDFDREFPISVLEVVLSGLQGRRGFRSPYTREDREKAMALLASSGLPKRPASRSERCRAARCSGRCWPGP